MKKFFLVFFAAYLWLFLGPVFAADGGFKITISAEPPPEIMAIVQTTPVDFIAGFGFASRYGGPFDFGLEIYSKYGSTAPEIPDAYMLLSLSPAKDEKGDILPEKYMTKLAGLVFMDEKIAWFVSEEAKKAFIKATE